ncbi:hypothetical protein [Bacillus infantis]|uniref:hypothetical protein n=1 Tax=Bacillus infantis TaxID=324767 RepID=UPI00209FA59C|nr:hypothetical protein [Bacillus infantis]MCP1161336.1 hypothetical protein [Bacillus infantis]
MLLPFSVIENLSPYQIDAWKKFYEKPNNQVDRKVEEGLWRRTQCFENKVESGWGNSNDCRRRMLQYKHTYDLLRDNNENPYIALVDTYTWIHYCLPNVEASRYLTKIFSLLKEKNWELIEEKNNKKVYKKGELCYRVELLEYHEEDKKEGRIFPLDYQMFEVTIFSSSHKFDPSFIHKPWEVLKTGVRKKEVREEGILDTNLEEIPSFFPAQVELGCGASIEANIPPLNFLHTVYNVTDKNTNKFILDHSKDTLPFVLITDTVKKFEEMTYMFKQCFNAVPTQFYSLLRDLYDNGYIVGDIITNNFDGLIEKVGLPEKYVRRYDEANIIPKIDFHQKAKSLLVIGSHADRRKIQSAARLKGLKVIYLDPEGYSTPEGFIDYPLESLKKEDLYLKEGATESLIKISEALKTYQEMETV